MSLWNKLKEKIEKGKSVNASKMLSELIKELQEIYEDTGDMPVVSATNFEGIAISAVRVDMSPYYYDGGCLYPAEEVEEDEHCTKWKLSKNNLREFGERFLIIGSDCPDLGDGGDIVNGVQLPVVPEKDDNIEWSEIESAMDNVRTAFEKALKK